MTGERVEVAIICVAHNSSDHLPSFFESLCMDQGDGRYRVVVVDSGSSDDTVKVALSHRPTVETVCLDANRGFACGINTGISHVRATGGARTYVVANPDVRFTLRDAHRMDAELRSKPALGLICPQIRDADGRRLDSLRRRPDPWMALLATCFGSRTLAHLGAPTEVIRGDSAYRIARQVAWATGGMLAVSEDCVLAVGRWREDFFMYEEEVDYCLRAAAQGFVTAYEPTITVTRLVGADVDAPWRHALSQVNRLTRERESGGDRMRRVQFVVEGASRWWRPKARAALWAVVTGASPQEVMDRYRPDAEVVIGGTSLSFDVDRAAAR